MEQRRSGNNKKTQQNRNWKKYAYKNRRWGRACVAPGGLTCVVCPAIGESEGVGVAPCLLVFLEPAQENWGGKVSKYPPGRPGPLPDERCHTFSWLHELAGGCRRLQDLSHPACEQRFSPSTSGTAAGAQRQVGTRRSFKGALYRGHPRADLPCSKSLLHVLLAWSSCSCSLCLKFGVLLNHWAVNTNPFFSGLEARWEGLKLCCCWTPEAKLSSGSLLWGQAWSQETEGSFPLLRNVFFFFFFF